MLGLGQLNQSMHACSVTKQDASFFTPKHSLLKCLEHTFVLTLHRYPVCVPVNIKPHNVGDLTRTFLSDLKRQLDSNIKL